MMAGSTEKLIDAYVKRSYARPMMMMVLLFVILVVILVVGVGAYGKEIYQAIQEMMRDGGNTKMLKVVGEIGFEVLAKSVTVILASVSSGLLVNYFNVRRSKVLEGSVDHEFASDYTLIVGYDFQVVNLVRKLLSRSGSTRVVVMTEQSAMKVYSEIVPKLSNGDYTRFFVLHRDIASPASFSRLSVSGADGIFIIGDEGMKGRDGKATLALQTISQKAKDETVGAEHSPVKTYLHIEDPIIYFRMRASKLPLDDDPRFTLEVFNYYESWIWQCWSNLKAGSGRSGYLPLRHRKGTRRAELFVIGNGNMVSAVVGHAIPLMNYGGRRGDSRITILHGAEGKNSLPWNGGVLAELPEVEVVQVECDGLSQEVDHLMMAAAQRADTSTTVVVAMDDPDEALRTYLHFSPELLRNDVSILIWQRLDSKDCPNSGLMRLGGMDGRADRTSVRYMGMTDYLPWLESDRVAGGAAVNFFYWKFCLEKERCYPGAADARFPDVVREVWDEKSANAKWFEVQRWRKWSCISNSDALRERNTLFSGGAYSVEAAAFLVAEHNRWWSERLLTGWKYDRVTDKTQLRHADMVPFEELSQETQDQDKISLAAFFTASTGLRQSLTSGDAR